MHEHLKISVSDDGTRAYVTNDELSENHVAAEEELVKFFGERGIVFGLKEGLCSAVTLSAAQRTPVLIAEGIEPVVGKDGWVECLIDVQTPELLEEKGGVVDMHNLHRIHNVKKGERLVVIHPPEDGTPGMSVRGFPILPKPGKKARVFRGTCIASDPNQPDVLTATEDGHFLVKSDGTIEVQPVLTIRGDVDFSTGDIDFIGSLIVTGDVKSDFTLKVKKDIEVRGNVGDATIMAGGNVIVKSGFLGYGKGSITAEGSVTIRHVLNQTVFSGKNVTIEREAVCAKINAGDVIASPKARFVGCVLRAGNGVEVYDLGNGDDTQAIVRVGRRGELLEKCNSINNSVAQIHKQAGEVKECLFKLIRMQLDAPLSAEQNALLTKLQGLQSEFPSALVNLQQEKTEVEGALQAAESARVVARGTVYVNVLLEINGTKKLVQNALREVMFTEKNGKIEEQSATVS
ncbi:MAG TPA: FapA family protein [Bacteroidota bacterium]|nr:FapA family protein [Bacteroidota bacterium]